MKGPTLRSRTNIYTVEKEGLKELLGHIGDFETTFQDLLEGCEAMLS